MTSERRHHSRHHVVRPSPLLILSPAGAVLGLAVPDEVSAGGARLLTSRGYATGEILTMMPQGPHPLANRCLPFRIMRSRRLDGGYEVAGAFEPPLAEAEALALAGI